MTLHGIGSAEADTTVGGVYALTAAGAIVSSPALSGTNSFEIDPVNGDANDRYGWAIPLPNSPNFMLTSFIFQNGADFDANIAIAELGNGDIGDPLRLIALDNNEAISIFDKQDDQVGTSVNGYIVAGTAYYFLWYYDQRNTTITRDILWIYKPAATLSNKTTISFSDANPDTISDSASGFGIFSAGMIITVSGSTSNDGTYTIDSLTAGVITLVSGDELTTESAGDTVTITHSAQWYKTIDVSGHGDGVDEIDSLVFGTKAGKGALPTVGGPFYVDDMVFQNLENGPNQHPLASITGKVRMPSANGTDTDFDTGTGTNPDWNDVDEIPADDATTTDVGDVVNDKVSYAISDAASGDDVLAVQIIGKVRRTGSGRTTGRPYIYDGTTRDTDLAFNFGGTGWIGFPKGLGNREVTYNQINGTNLSETLFNTLEAGFEITVLAASDTVELSQIGLEYAIPGPRELPQDFPILSAGVALGSGNMGII